MRDGNFMAKEPNDLLEFLDEIAKKTPQWEGPNSLERLIGSKPLISFSSEGIYQ